MWEEDKEIRERGAQPATSFQLALIGAIIIIHVRSYVITIRLFGTTPLQFSLYRAHAIFYS